jgi:hypothetical protein
MSTAFAISCAVLFYAFLALIGRAVIVIIGPTRLASIESHALAPIAGLSVLTLLTSYLVMAQIPLAKVSAPLAVVFAFLAVIAILVKIRCAPAEKRGPLFLREYWIPFLVVSILIFFPFTVGGYQFSILRGNGTDAFNYVTMADAISHYPIDWLMSQPKDVLADQSPSLPHAQNLLKTRWSTSALLAFSATALSISPIEFEYTFTLTLMLVLFNSLVVVLSATRTLTKATIWIVVAYVAGFWGQFILDLRAFSQIAASPIIAVLLSWLLAPINQGEHLFRYGAVLTAVLFAALFFQYPEIIVVYLPGAIVVFLARAWWGQRKSSSLNLEIGHLVGFLALFLLLSAPLMQFILGFAYDQVRLASNPPLGWDNAYFSWMKNPVRGVWGGGVSPGLGAKIDTLFAWLSFGIGTVLCIGAMIRFIAIVKDRSQWTMRFPEAAVFFLTLFGAAEVTLLYAKSNPWSAFKVMSYFAMLIPIIIAGWLTWDSTRSMTRYRSVFFSRILAIAIFSWIAMNALLAGARIVHAYNDSDFGRYISSHGEYRRINAEGISQVQRLRRLSCPQNSKVAIFDPSASGREFRTHLVDGNGFLASTPPYKQIRSNDQTIKTVPDSFDCVFANRSYFDSKILVNSESTREMFTASTSENFIALVDVSGEYGTELDKVTSKRFAFAGSKNIELIMLGRTKRYSLMLKFCPVAPRKPEEAISIFVDAGNIRIVEFELIDCTEKTLELAGSIDGFVQKINISNHNRRHEPTLIGADPRDLRLRVDVIKVRLSESGN